ncbi:MAG: hypothetical protein ACI9UT_000903 [Flavobacteriales bacterium]|jgi:hypothetical protein
MKKKTIVVGSTCLFLLTVSPLILAKSEARPKGPPIEAIQACKNKEHGDEVIFTSRRGDKIIATCEILPKTNTLLVAVPKNHKKPRNDK